MRHSNRNDKKQLKVTKLLTKISFFHFSKHNINFPVHNEVSAKFSMRRSNSGGGDLMCPNPKSKIILRSGGGVWGLSELDVWWAIGEIW